MRLQTPPANESFFMNEIPPEHETPPEPHSDSSEKLPIRKSQEEFVDDMAGPSMDKSEYEQRQGQTARRNDSDDARPPDQR